MILRTDAMAAIGHVSSARACMLDGFKQIASSGAVFRMTKIFPAVVRRFPKESEPFEQFAGVMHRAGVPEAAELAKCWLRSRRSALPVPAANRKRCFVVANGPSLGDMPLHLLEGEDVFCVNRGIRAMALGLPRPRYVAVSDPAVYRDYGDEIDAAEVDRLFISGSCLWARPKNFAPNVNAFGNTQLHLSAGQLIPAPLLLHLGSTVVLSVCQLAHFMGYREIHVLGVDLTYDGPATHFYGGGDKESRRLSSFREGENGPTWVNLGFSNLAAVLAPYGTRMFNAGIGGKLTALGRVSLVDVINTQRANA